MVSYIISVRGCDARISAATLIVYSGLSRSSIRSDIGARASTDTVARLCVAACSQGGCCDLNADHVFDSSRVHRKWGIGQSDCRSGLGVARALDSMALAL